MTETMAEIVVAVWLLQFSRHSVVPPSSHDMRHGMQHDMRGRCVLAGGSLDCYDRAELPFLSVGTIAVCACWRAGAGESGELGCDNTRRR
jgi:hypothetical protein